MSLGTATFILAPDPRSQGGTDWAKETLIMPNGQDIREVDDRRNPLSTCEDNLNTTAFHSDSLEVTATILTETDIKQEPELENSVSVPEHIELSSESGDSEFDEEKESDGCESEPKTKRQKKVPKEDSDWAPSKDSSEESGESGESISEDSENSDESDYEHKRQKSQQHNPFQCLKCDREYEIHMELCTHIVKEHTTEESRQVDVCVLCTKPWTPALLGKHMREVHGVEDFVDWSADNNLQCTRCSNIHQDVLSFLFHLEDAHRTTAVKCSKCEFTSIYTYQLFRHMAKKHGCMDQENVVVTNKRPVYRKGTVIGTAIDPVTCALCGATPGINLNKHIQAEHPEALALHKYSCYICPSVSPSYNVLRGHFRARHNGRQCCFCPFSCRHRSLMEDHVWMKHLNITKYTCKLCHTPLHFTRKCRYLVHTKRVHEGKKDYLCHECGKSFKTSSSFQIHYRQHTGEKPIMCTECGFRCRQPNSLNWHKKKHHPK